MKRAIIYVVEMRMKKGQNWVWCSMQQEDLKIAEVICDKRRAAGLQARIVQYNRQKVIT